MSSVNLDTASLLDITCRRGDTFSLSLNISQPDGSTPLDTTLYTFEMAIKNSAGAVILTIADGEMTKGADGTLVITKDAVSMEINPGVYFYDLEATRIADSVVRTWLYGNITVNSDVT